MYPDVVRSHAVVSQVTSWKAVLVQDWQEGVRGSAVVQVLLESADGAGCWRPADLSPGVLLELRVDVIGLGFLH